MFSTIKTYLTAALGIALAVLAALFYRNKAKDAEKDLAAEKQARETETKATEAMTQGLENENKAAESTPPAGDRSHFE